MILFFRSKATGVTPQIKHYSSLVENAILMHNLTFGEFIAETKSLGASIRDNFQMLSTMKRHWMIGKMVYDWMHLGNQGQITIILPSVESMWMVRSLLKRVGIREELITRLRVEQKMLPIALKRKKKNKCKHQMGSRLVFKMTYLLDNVTGF